MFPLSPLPSAFLPKRLKHRYSCKHCAIVDKFATFAATSRRKLLRLRSARFPSRTGLAGRCAEENLKRLMNYLRASSAEYRRADEIYHGARPRVSSGDGSAITSITVRVLHLVTLSKHFLSPNDSADEIGYAADSKNRSNISGVSCVGRHGSN